MKEQGYSAVPSSFHSFSWTNIREIIDNVNYAAVYKLLSGFGLIMWGWTFGGHESYVLAVAALVALDTITGMWKACRSGGLSSKGFFRFATKLVVYLILLATASIVDKALPISFAMTMMVTFLSITEAISVLENVALLGFPVPTQLLRLLKDYNEKAKTDLKDVVKPNPTKEE